MDQGRQVFSVDLLERHATKNRGMITCMAAGNDVIVLGTSKGWIIRNDFGVWSSYDIDLSVGRTGEQSIHKVFVHPGGSRCIATVTGVGGAETFYMHAKWPKLRVLCRLNGLLVNTVAWNKQQITEVSTKEIILGTQDGQLCEMAVDEKDKIEIREVHRVFVRTRRTSRGLHGFTDGSSQHKQWSEVLCDGCNSHSTLFIQGLGH